ncbi:CobW family GTP-binding protein [Rhizorhabdus dicambivorans]|uniref:GTP-binding protein n=1 Tax=Rhizorhabdus dicambivorans TaxID=1850238 RepID=A0A2A4FXW1_9SPHN|nr:GTP-binding protein [Rhizorhabdus dicambivorans]ATE64143.1 GTP-binding protein [Rhizorhabdus dicambivorans]PCE42586.1 GTP-binding protein [Rhizorhabdus dicambivorans]
MLSGFLGSGKSTLLNAMLRNRDMPPTAVIINEFGEVAIDHALIEGVVDGVTLLGSGCVCCAVRSDLEAALRDLYLKHVRGLIPPFSRVILETTGLADPGPVLQTLSSRPVQMLRYRLNGLVTLVDAVHGEAALARHHEAVQQIAMADSIVLTKIDLASSTDAVRAAVHDINPSATVLAAIRGEIAPHLVLAGRAGADLGSEAKALTNTAHHSHGILSKGRQFHGRLDWEKVEPLLRAFLRMNGDRLLRLKGILWLGGVERPVAVHAVHHSLYPVDPVAASVEPGISSVVVIGDHLDEAVVDELMNGLASAVEA